ncbi:hypothetical protein LSI01_09950 [Furfurilactobacillus siliginis]|uniref:Uncharacterized protein n=2 Tax=Furfurilactobacillus siliginis TaxID=348151 RepID=A0A510VP17_9LACO|nr:hypothetical protein LSI01_09950 [Furfurilactobacillus siliginis]
MEMQNFYEALRYDEQVGLKDMNVLPKDWDDIDYFELHEIMSARSEENRPQDPVAMINR